MDVREPQGGDQGSSRGRFLHLTPAEIWEGQNSTAHYLPEAYAADGFIHCTIGEENLIAVANAFYAGDAREQVVLEIEPSRLTVPVRFEDPGRIYPHLHGPLNREAVVAVRRVRRGGDGVFVAIEEAAAE
jgi:uncharacterized protein (DUF952 family)